MDKNLHDNGLNFFDLGFKDYMASRLLLRHRLLPQGIILASSSIEKYLKGVVCFAASEGVCQPPKKMHLNSTLIGNAAENGTLIKTLNREFLEYLAKAYQLRYIDNLPDGYNISIDQTKVLAELDYTVFEIESRLHLRRSDGREAVTRFRDALNTGKSIIVEDNHILAAIDKNEFIAQNAFMYAVRRLDDGALIEIEYEFIRTDSEDSFLLETLIPS